jgi:hypothetical protein
MLTSDIKKIPHKFMVIMVIEKFDICRNEVLVTIIHKTSIEVSNTLTKACKSIYPSNKTQAKVTLNVTSKVRRQSLQY